MKKPCNQGRPSGGVRVCVLQWLMQAGTEGMTLRELAAALSAPIGHVRQTLRNLKRDTQVGIIHCRKVAYRNRPVAVYVLAELMPALPADLSATQRLAGAIHGWGKGGVHGD